MKKAIIYLRGHSQEMQEIFCIMHAAYKDYTILSVATDIDEVNNCDVLIVASVSRISRNQVEFHRIVNELKEKGITIESAIEHEKADEFLSSAMNIVKQKRG